MERREFLTTLAGTLLTWGVPACRRPDSSWSESAALDYLVSCQSPDGAWRSKVYGMFRGGEALTPLVLCALHRQRPEAAQLGAEWVAKQALTAWTLFPVHNACWLLKMQDKYDDLIHLKGPLANRLLDLQMGSERSWDPSHPYHGGWSYAGQAPDFQTSQEVPAMQQPNLSATVLAMVGLRAAGLPSSHPAIQEALTFVDSCQNFGSPDSNFDDGGFHQMRDDLMRNKGGQAGQDSTGTLRFHSYAAATSDGLRGMLLGGRTLKHPRVATAVQWMRDHPTVSDVADLHCYAAYARKQVHTLLGGRIVPVVSPTLNQRADGSVRNPQGEMRENDPLVATSLAIMSR